MKVLRICPEFFSENNIKIDLSDHMRNLSKALKMKGINQTILTEHSDIDEFEGMQILKYKSTWPFSHIRKGLFAFERIKEIKDDFDVIHFHNHGPALISLKKNELKSLVMTLHGSPREVRLDETTNFELIKQNFYFYFMSKFAAKRVDRIVCLSPQIKDSIVNDWKIPESRCRVISAGVDTEKFKPMKMEKQYDLIFAGRLSIKKRSLFLLKLIKKLAEENREIKCLILGASEEDPDYKKTMKAIKKNHLERNVEVREPVGKKKLVEFLNKSKVLTLTSSSEGTPRVILEAMSCEIPVIATDIFGNRQMMVNEKTGFLVDKDNFEKFLEKTKSLLKDENQRNEFGKFGRQRVVEKFSWEIKAKDYKQLYDELIKK